jgi:hypothetical protein
MVKQASLQWNRLRRYLIADPGDSPAARTRVRPRVFPGRHRRPT